MFNCIVPGFVYRECYYVLYFVLFSPSTHMCVCVCVYECDYALIRKETENICGGKNISCPSLTHTKLHHHRFSRNPNFHKKIKKNKISVVFICEADDDFIYIYLYIFFCCVDDATVVSLNENTV